MKNLTQHLIAEVPRRRSKVEMTIGIDLGDVWSHYCTLNQEEEVVDRGRFRTAPKAIEKWFTDMPPACVALEVGTHSIWVSERLQELGHDVIVANVRELRAISHSDRKSDQVDAEKLARYARLDPEILRPICHRTVEQQEALTLIRARDLMVRLRTAAVNAVRGLTKDAKLRSVRDHLGEIYDFRLKDHATYQFHITMSYQMAPFLPEERNAYRELLGKPLRRIVDAQPVLELGNPEYCTFPDMFRFEPRGLLVCS